MIHGNKLITLLLIGLSVGAHAREPADADWDAAYERLLKTDAEVRAKVESGGATKEDVIEWMKKTGQRDATSKTAATKDLTAFREKLSGLVQSGKLTKDEAKDLLEIMINTDQPDSKRSTDLERLATRLKAAVNSGKMTEAEAKAAFQQASKQTRRGDAKSRGKLRRGNTNFYAIVLGRLKSKDIELGEFTLEVDHVTSMYDNRWVKDEIIGQPIKVTGVAGPFLDKLLQIKRGKTLKVRSGNYNAKSKSLGFAHKFHVLEETAPFRSEEFGVPPDDFRGFRGILQGQIDELGGYEVLMTVSKVASVENGSKATDVDSIKGRRVRVVGFYQRHGAAFNDLHVGDTIRLSVSHDHAAYDELNVTDQLERLE